MPHKLHDTGKPNITMHLTHVCMAAPPCTTHFFPAATTPALSGLAQRYTPLRCVLQYGQLMAGSLHMQMGNGAPSECMARVHNTCANGFIRADALKGQ